MKTIKRLLLVLSLLEILLLSINNINIVESKTQVATEVTISNNREPRIVYKDNDKNYFIIFIHDDAGIKLDKTSVTVNGKKYKLELIETSGNSGDKKGVYNKKGKRIRYLSNSKSYKGKRYDYGIKIKNSNLSTDFKNEISVVTYDHGGNCYLKETFRVKRLAKVDSNGIYYKIDRAPRATTIISNNMLNISAIDYSGIKSLKVYSDKTNELLYSFSAEKDGLNTGVNNLLEVPKDGTTKNGYRKSGIIYPYRIEDRFPKEKAKISSKKYKIKVIAEDLSGIKSEKNMIFKLKLVNKNSSSGNNGKGNTSNGNKPNGNTSNGNKPNGNTSNGNKPNGNTSNGNTSNGNKPNGNTSNGNTSNENKPNGNTSNGTNIKKIKIKKIEFIKSTYEVEEGKNVNIGLKITPSNANDYKLSWNTNDSKIAKVKGNGLSGIATGLKADKSTKIKVVDTSYPKGKEPTAECTIKVKKTGAFDFNLSKTKIETKTTGKQQEHKIIISGCPEKYNGEKVYFKVSTSNSKIATIAGRSDGEKTIKVITRDNYGSAIVTVKAYGRNSNKILKTKKVNVKVIKGVIAATSIKIEPASNGTIKIKKGDTIQFKAIVTPKNTTEKIIWSTSNNNIVVDNNGRVTAKKALGQASVYAQCGNQKAGQSIEVGLTSGIKSGSILVKSVKLNKHEIEIEKGKTTKLIATINPSNATNKNIKWTEINYNNVFLQPISLKSDGTIKAKNTGKSTVYATAKDGTGAYDTCVVRVIDPVNEINLYKNYGKSNQSKIGSTLSINRSLELIAEVIPKSVTHSVTASSSNSNVMKVQQIPGSGVILLEGVQPGTATLKVKSGSKTKSVTVSVMQGNAVNANTVKVTNVTLNHSSLKLNVGNSSTALKVSITPNNATNKNVTWSSSNTKVATVNSNGKIEARSKGITTITAIAKDGSGKKATCLVTVTMPKLTKNEDGIHVLKTNGSAQKSYTMQKSQKIKFALMVDDKIISNVYIKWNSSNKSVASVNSSGNVTANKTGETTISAEYKNKKYTCKLKVDNNELLFTSSSYVSAGKNLKINCDLSKTTKFNLELWKDGIKVNPKKYVISDKTVAKWNGSTVTVMKEGTTTITANYDGLKATCTINVTNSHSGTPNSNNNISNTNTGNNSKINEDKRKEIPSGGPAIIAKSIKLNYSSIILKVGSTKMLNASFSPSNVSNKTIYWTSSNSSVATVDIRGKVTAKKAGTATITAINRSSGKKATCKVTVTSPVTSITLSKSSATLIKGNTLKLTATANPKTATNKKITWGSYNPSVASVDSNGKVTAKKAGTATIQATASDRNGAKATCKITVKDQKVSWIKLNTYNVSLKTGQTKHISATAYPTTASNRAISWSSSNGRVAKVNSSGKITAKGPGTAFITAKSKDGGTKSTVTVKVTQPVTRISLNHYYITLYDGETKHLKATVSPSNASNKGVVWSYSNRKVAKVSSSGKVTAKGTGTGTITVKAKDGSGKKATCTVVVKSRKVSSISVTSSVTINKGASKKLSCSVHPSNATNKSVSWSSRDSSIASVSSSGRVTGKKAGTTWITVKAKDGSGKCARCRVTVKATTKSTTTNSGNRQRRGGNISW